MSAETKFDIDKALEALKTITPKEEKDLKSHFPEADLKALCANAQKIFMSQPALLELDAPINIVGASTRMLAIICVNHISILILPLMFVQAMCMDNILTSCECSSFAEIPLPPTRMCFLAITSIAVTKESRLCVC